MQVLVQQPHTRSPPRNLLCSEYYTWQASVYHLLGGFISWNQICAFFFQLISVNESIFNGYPKRRDLAEHVILLLPMSLIVTSHFHTWNPLNWQIAFSSKCTTSHNDWLYVLSILLPFTLLWNTKIKELLSIRVDEKLVIHSDSPDSENRKMSFTFIQKAVWNCWQTLDCHIT